VRKTSWGYTLQINGKQERKINAAWSEDDAEKALAARILERDVASPSSRPTLNLGEAVDRYFVAKASKRSLEEDRRHLHRLRDAFGAATPLAEISAARIAAYKLERQQAKVRRDGIERQLAPGNAEPRARVAATLAPSRG